MAIIGAVLVFIGGGIAYDSVRLRRVRNRRKGKGFTSIDFIDTFRPSGVPKTVSAAVFEYYSSSGVWKDFPFSPDDTCSALLCDDHQDIEDDGRHLVQKLGLIYLPEYILREYTGTEITTLRDMVLWLNWVSQHQPKELS